MSVLNASLNLFSHKVLASLLMALALVLSGCGGGAQTHESNAQIESDATGGTDETGGGSQDPIDEPATPAVLNLVSQPSSASIAEGESHTFVVLVEHENPITVTWSFNGSVVQRSSSTSLTASEAGTYRCSVTDGTTNVRCDSFTLTLTAEQYLTIDSQPLNQMVNEGVNVTMSVGATGSGNLSYQWYFNGASIAGATSAILELDSVTIADDGEYYVVVSNASGSTTSATASLNVAASSVQGRALITWNRPLMRADDSSLTDSEIQSYEIYHSDSANGTMERIDTVDAVYLDYTATGLAQGTHYFSLVTVDTSGLKSSLSDPVSVTIN